MTENSERPNNELIESGPPPESSETSDVDRLPASGPAPDGPDVQGQEAGALDEAVAVGPGASNPQNDRPANADKLSRVTLGGALLAIDAVSERLDRLEEAEADQAARGRSLDEVLVPMSDWEQRFGISADRPARHLMLGLMVDARARAGATVTFLNDVGNALANAVDFLLRPIRTRRAFRPVKRGFDRAVSRGEGQVERWRAMGRAEDTRSRSLAETALTNAVDETMDDLVANQRVEFFIQEIIESQTMGIVDEIIEEIRERAVSSDNFFERPIRRFFRRPDRSDVPNPDFDPQLVRPITRRGHPIPEWSLVGHYAGLVSRLLALLIDVGLIVIVLALGSSLLSTAINVLGLRESFDVFINNSGFIGGLFAAINGLLIVIGYLILFWLLTGQTLGMMLMGVRIVTRTGGRVTLWRAILRIIGYFVLPGIFFLGFLWILGDDQRQAWHDKLAGTYVVYAWDARPDETFLTYEMVMDR